MQDRNAAEHLPPQNDPLARYLGITLLEIGEGWARAVMESKPELLNSQGITHGAAIFALADVVFGAASNSHGISALALDIHISYIKATKAGEVLYAVAREENITSKTGLYRMELTDRRGDLIAAAQGRVIRRA